MNKPDFRYEYDNKFLWLIGFCGLWVLFISGLISYRNTSSVLSLILSTVVLILIGLQIYAKFTKKTPYLEIKNDFISWGYIGRSPDFTIDLNDISKFIFDHGVDDNDILILLKSGRMIKLHQLFYFTKRSELKKIINQKRDIFHYSTE